MISDFSREDTEGLEINCNQFTPCSAGEKQGAGDCFNSTALAYPSGSPTLTLPWGQRGANLH